MIKERTYIIHGKRYEGQEEYITGTAEFPHYEAHVEDEEGNEYMIIWELLPHCFTEDGRVWIEDGNDACDWDNPIRIERL